MLLDRLFTLPLGISRITGGSNPCIGLFGIGSMALGVAGSLIGGHKASKAAKKALAENRYRTNAEKAWYEKEYNTDYLDTKAGQNLLRKAQSVQDSYIRKADGASAVGGGTAASAALAKESANKTMGDTISNIGANDTARKRQVSDQHNANQQSLSKQREDIYQNQAANITNASSNMSNALLSAGIMEDPLKKVTGTE